ncbi:hypothetical protein D5E78_30180 [Vibrio parahaemolyticus]|nr:hypothetical protein D5E78_30180 [Vibrio parahaemolyticus]
MCIFEITPETLFEMTDDSKKSDAQLTEIHQISSYHPDPATIFVESQRNGYTNSLRSFTIPFFPQDRDKIGKIEDKYDDEGKLIEKASYVYTLKHKNLTIKYHAVAIETSNTEQEFYFATTNEQLVFQSIIDLISIGEASLRMESDDDFIVTFRVNSLREYLDSIGKARNGKVINKALETLERSTVEVEYHNSENKAESLTMSGTYLQSAKKLKSSDPMKNGMYQARLHPHFARDIINGEYRFIEDTYVHVRGKSYALYNQVLHKMRHHFTNASAKMTETRQVFHFDLSDIFFSSGFRPDFAEATARRNIMELKKLLLESEVIESKEDFSYQRFLDKDRDVVDFKCSLIPSIKWGKSQRLDNHINNNNNEKLELFRKKINQLPHIIN